MAPKSGYRRGYAVAVIVGLTETSASLWRVYSRVVKPEAVVQLENGRKDAKAVYNFHEAITNALRSTLKEGVRSMIIVSPPRTTYGQDFVDHVERHHAWLMRGANKVAFAEIIGSAATRSDISTLAKNPVFRKLVKEGTAEETEDLLELLERRINDNSGNYAVLFSIDEAENLILHPQERRIAPEFLFLTSEFLSSSRQKGRLNRLMQVAANKKVKTRVVDAETAAGKRLTQLGGIVCLARTV